MYNLHFSGSSNNFKAKVKAQNSNCLNLKTKLNQYLEKNRKEHKSPADTLLNKSQNISRVQNLFKTNTKNKIVNNNNKNNKSQLQAKKIMPIQNLKNNYSIKISSIQYQNNLSMSKNNSLSNYFTKSNVKNAHNLNFKRNYTNSNNMSKINISHHNISNLNTNNYNSNFFQNKYHYYYSKKNSKKKENSLNKIKEYLKTDDFIIIKNNNRNTSLYPLVITEELKKKDNFNNTNTNTNKSNSKIKKIESVNNTFIKKNHSSIKKLKTSSTSVLNKKTNFILNINNNNSNNNQNNSRVHSNIMSNPFSSSGGFIENLSTEKTSGCARLDSLESKIMKEINELKNCQTVAIIDKIKSIFEEVIDCLIPKESQNIFILLVNEVSNITKKLCDNIIHYKEMVENLKIRINRHENKYNDLINRYRKQEKELINLRKEIEDFYEERNINDRYSKKSSFDMKIKRSNLFFKELNEKNIDDLDALYFFDKVDYNQNEEKDIPKLNLEQSYIEKCIQKEIIKRNEDNLTPFQKIALQFEMQDT